MNDHEDRQAAEAAQAAAQFTVNLETPQMLETPKLRAKYRRAQYLAYCAAGFSPGQALYLCTVP